MRRRRALSRSGGETTGRVIGVLACRGGAARPCWAATEPPAYLRGPDPPIPRNRRLRVHFSAGSALRCEGGEVRILVVEDDKQLAAALRRGLEREGYAVDVALDGTEGEW